jgi:low temperature requirement protein LtrA
VLVAVGDELVIAHPRDELHDAGALVALGGPALFLGGLMACAARVGQSQSLPRVVAVVALLGALPLAARADGLVVAALLTALLAGACGRRALARRALSRAASATPPLLLVQTGALRRARLQRPPSTRKG